MFRNLERRFGGFLIVTALAGALGACGGGSTGGDSGSFTSAQDQTPVDSVPIGDDSNVIDSSSGSGDPSVPPVNAVPIARIDSVAVNDGVAATLDVLANDSGLTDVPVTLTISANPAHGAASVSSDNMIVYTANSGYMGADSLTYRITDRNGEAALASVSIQVGCTSCAAEKVVTLSWNQNPDNITGYQVFRGPTAAQATVLVSNLPLNSGLIDPTAPRVQYRARADLGLSVGEQACFRVKAYNNEVSSDYSQAVCGVS